jgi:hypothetical protein
VTKCVNEELLRTGQKTYINARAKLDAPNGQEKRQPNYNVR